MHALILCNAEGHEVGRRPMDPGERYAYYRHYAEGEPITVGEACYQIQSVAWRIPEHDLVLRVVSVPPELRDDVYEE